MHYRITAKLGEGGMGEVYRARDTKLGREVAIKVLPKEFVADPERLARFAREARMLASLNHPSVAAIHGLEEDAVGRFLVLELVEGQDLAKRLKDGAMPLEEALEVARQVTEGLEAAHARDIVHRDLKPANLMLTAEGRIKILDLGLAKGQRAAVGATGDLTHSPTLTAQQTRAGAILGTAAYMSPEQASGADLDARSDIWSFGVVVYEMLTGRRPFQGDNLSQVLAAVLKEHPDLAALPSATPPAIRRLVERCLRKKPRERLQAIGDARVVLEEVLGGQLEEVESLSSAGSAPVSWRRILPWALAGATVLVLIAMLVGRSVESSAPPEPRFFEMPLSEMQPGDLVNPVISPDGRWIVVSVGFDADSSGQLHLRSLDAFGSEVVPGTEEAYAPFWSPDSRDVGYFAKGELRRLELATRTSRTICACAPSGRGGAWTADDTILFAPTTNDGIYEVSAEGGDPARLTTVDPGLVDGSHRFPALLPDGHHFLFTVWSNNVAAMAQSGGIFVGSRDGGPLRRLLSDPSQAVFVAPDRLLIHRGDQLVSVAFDPETFEVGREPIPVARGVQNAITGALSASVSRSGDLLFAVPSTGVLEADLSWVDREGVSTPAFLRNLRLYGDFDVSPDGFHFAAILASPDRGPDDLWAGDLERGTLLRLTGAQDAFAPRFSPDGRWIAFASERTGDRNVYRIRAEGGGTTEVIFADETANATPEDWPRGDLLLMGVEPKTGGRSSEIWGLDPTAGEPGLILAVEGSDLSQPRLSPDGRWLAVVSDESGRPEVLLWDYLDLQRVWPVSVGGGTDPHWRADSSELVFLDLEQQVLAVSIAPGADPRPGRPRLLFTVEQHVVAWSPVADHSRFLVAGAPEQPPQRPLRLILDAGPLVRGVAPRR